MKKLLLALAFLTAGGLSAQPDNTYHGYYDYYGSSYYYGLPSFTQIAHVYYVEFSNWFGSGAYCNVYPSPNDNIDFAFQMPCNCPGGCVAVLDAVNQSNLNLHAEGVDWDVDHTTYEQDFAWDYACYQFYTGPTYEYSDFFGCP